MGNILKTEKQIKIGKIVVAWNLYSSIYSKIMFQSVRYSIPFQDTKNIPLIWIRNSAENSHIAITVHSIICVMGTIFAVV